MKYTLDAIREKYASLNDLPFCKLGELGGPSVALLVSMLGDLLEERDRLAAELESFTAAKKAGRLVVLPNTDRPPQNGWVLWEGKPVFVQCVGVATQVLQEAHYTPEDKSFKWAFSPRRVFPSKQKLIEDLRNR